MARSGWYNDYALPVLTDTAWILYGTREVETPTEAARLSNWMMQREPLKP